MPSGLAVLAWRLGLGWLFGRKWVLITTTTASGSIRRTATVHVLGDGNLYVPAEGDHADDLRQTPRALAQAAPGPLGVRPRQPTPAEVAALPDGRWLVLEPTADPVPEIVPPDLVWLVPVGGAALLAASFALGRRRPPPAAPAR